MVVGIAASGTTPYVRAALARAQALGARTAFVSCSEPPKRLRETCDVCITVLVGPEIVTGSTRMKAGTATKLVLNTLTTGAMIRLGKTYGNLMVDLRAWNDKLIDRSQRIVMETDRTGPRRGAEGHRGGGRQREDRDRDGPPRGLARTRPSGCWPSTRGGCGRSSAILRRCGRDDRAARRSASASCREPRSTGWMPRWSGSTGPPTPRCSISSPAPTTDAERAEIRAALDRRRPAPLASPGCTSGWRSGPRKRCSLLVQARCRPPISSLIAFPGPDDLARAAAGLLAAG